MTILRKPLFSGPMNTTLSNTTAHQAASPAYQAFRILQVGFIAAPILAGLDKFFHLLVNWDQYLPAIVAQRITHRRA